MVLLFYTIWEIDSPTVNPLPSGEFRPFLQEKSDSESSTFGESRHFL